MSSTLATNNSNASRPWRACATSFLAGLYGMNFDIMPELHLEYGYYGLLSVMMTVAISLLAIFRIKRVVNVQLTSN
ncbi:MAG: hypothetical protein ACI81O_000745 [Cyclobacteriaceae bacterium]|jgi:hypothetical protein